MTTPNTLQDRVLVLVKTLQFAWFTGHLLTLIGTLAYVCTVIMFRSNSFFYKMAYFGALVSYGVVIYKIHGKPQVSTEYVRKVIMGENAQYLILAIFWFFTSPITVTLIPFFTFSAFHALGYIRTNIIPKVFPRPAQTTDGAAATDDAAGSSNWQAKYQKTIKSWSDKYYDAAMRFVAQTEVTVVAVRLLLGLFRLRILPVILFVQFLRFRYHLSSYTRRTFKDVCDKFDSLLLPPNADPRIPPVVTNVYNTVKGIITKFGSDLVRPAPAAAE